MNTDHWNRLFAAWAGLPAPRTVSAPVVSAVSDLIKPVQGRILLLGVTREFSELGSDLTAIDNSESLVRRQWRGNTPTRRAVIGDWLTLPFADASFAAAIGDGALNTLNFPDQVTSLLKSLSRVLASRGLFACRVFTAPEQGETMSAIAQATRQGEVNRFQTLKFRIGMAIAHAQRNPNVEVTAIHRAFEEIFPDRGDLANATGWNRPEIDTIDVYAKSPVRYNFPTLQQCREAVPAEFENIRFVTAAGYEMSKRYPLLVAERR